MKEKNRKRRRIVAVPLAGFDRRYYGYGLDTSRSPQKMGLTTSNPRVGVRVAIRLYLCKEFIHCPAGCRRVPKSSQAVGRFSACRSVGSVSGPEPFFDQSQFRMRANSGAVNRMGARNLSSTKNKPPSHPGPEVPVQRPKMSYPFRAFGSRWLVAAQEADPGGLICI
ncbi:hypothetical protein BJX63DRAFT_214646 [Aspergillus granulosus]|uniref:Uncharacterized protein n=1 Tax=Aspergillus granulosus TaxID=176169 RepID=A0ABR4HE32_9EURO